MGQAMGKVFGSADKDATLPVKGPEGAAGPEQLDPNQGLSKWNMFARKALAGGLMGGGKAMQQESQQQQRPAPPMNMAAFQQPQIDTGGGQQDSNYLIQARKRFDPFYGGQ